MFSALDLLGINKYIAMVSVGVNLALLLVLWGYVRQSGIQHREIGSLQQQLKNCDDAIEVERHMGRQAERAAGRQCEELRRYYESLPTREKVLKDRDGNALPVPHDGMLDMEEAGASKTTTSPAKAK